MGIAQFYQIHTITCLYITISAVSNLTHAASFPEKNSPKTVSTLFHMDSTIQTLTDFFLTKQSQLILPFQQKKRITQ